MEVETRDSRDQHTHCKHSAEDYAKPISLYTFSRGNRQIVNGFDWLVGLIVAKESEVVLFHCNYKF